MKLYEKLKKERVIVETWDGIYLLDTRKDDREYTRINQAGVTTLNVLCRFSERYNIIKQIWKGFDGSQMHEEIDIWIAIYKADGANSFDVIYTPKSWK